MYLQLLLWDGNRTQKPPKLAPSPPDTKGFHRMHQPFNFNNQQHNPHLNPNPNTLTKKNDAAATGHPTSHSPPRPPLATATSPPWRPPPSSGFANYN